MKNKMKLMAVAGLCCAMTAVGGVLFQKDLGNVSADTTQTLVAPATINDVAGNFEMISGASARLKTGEAGIRWTTFITKEWYALAKADETTTVKFYTIVNKYNNEDENEWSAPIEASEVIDFSKGNATCEITGAVIYDNLSDANKLQAYNLQLEAKCYAEITKEGSAPVVVWANREGIDTVRSIAQVADNLMRTEGATDDLTPTQLKILNDYRVIEKAENVYIDKTNGTFDVTTVFPNAKVLRVVMNDSKDTYADGVYNFDDVPTTAASASGAIIYTDKGIIDASFNVCTKVIKTVADWKGVFNVNAKITGYYYLGNDITEYPELVIDKKIGNDYAFSGVFDGGGHEASFTVKRNRGIFAYLADATVKNVQFNLKISPSHPTNTTLCGAMTGLAATVWNNVNISDMYLKIEEAKSCSDGVFAPITSNAAYPITMTRVVIEMPTAEDFTKNNINTAKYSSFANVVSAFDTATGVEDDWNWYFKSELFVISDLPLARNVKASVYGDTSAYTVYAPNAMPDKDGNTVIDANDIDTTNKITYLGQVKNGGPIYSYATKDLLISAGHTFKAYTTNSFWDVTSGAPVFVGK